MVVGTPVLQIVGQYVYINLRKQIPMPGFLFFPMISTDATLVNIGVFSMASGVFVMSKTVIEDMKQKIEPRLSWRKTSLQRRQIKAFTPIKIT